MQKISIAIDGPAGAGKSTIAKEIAKQLKIVYVDTGAMYRAFGLHCLRNNIESNSDRMNDIINEVNIEIEYLDNVQQILLNGENVTHLIRSDEVSSMASAISVHKNVRLKLVSLQRQLAEKTSVVMDGRDIGTYVLPNATIKIYLNASVKDRARRRWLELTEKGSEVELEQVQEEIIVRDHRDINREFAPLRKAEDAIEIDTSNLTIRNVVDKIIHIINEL